MKGIACALLVIVGGASMAVDRPPTEFRGIWVDGFNEGIKTPEQVDTLLRRVRGANMNAVVVQVRKRGDAYYVSHYEPRAADMAPGFDSLAYLIQKAHDEKPYVEVHAWLNACAVGGNPDPQSITSLHRDFLSLSDTGEDYDKEATKIDPGNPGALEWTARVYLDVLRHYDVDAVHFDFIRYGGRNWGYNPVSVQRYNERYGQPTGYKPPWYDWRWMKWRRDNITNLVRKVYALGMDANPRACMSAATICWGNGPANVDEYRHRSSAYMAVWQDWQGWMAEGLLDINIPMAYFQEVPSGRYWDNWIRFIEDNRFEHYAAPGCGAWLNTIAQTIGQLAETREPTPAGNRADGVCIYAYSGTHKDVPNGPKVDKDGFFVQMREGLFATPASVLPYPWRSRPVDGLIKGTLLRSNDLAWCDPADVRLWRGAHLVATLMTDGTGFYAFTHVPPGRYIVEASYDGSTSRRDVTVGAGESVSEDFLFGDSTFRRLSTVADLRQAADGDRVLLQRRVVTEDMGGRTGAFSVADGLRGRAVRCEVASPLLLPLVRGDIVTLVGTVTESQGVRSLRDVSVQVVGVSRR